MGRNSKHGFNRKYDTRKPYKIIYIFTEGTKTEPNYFKSKKEEIRRNNIKIEIKGKGYNTLSLVEFALDYIAKESSGSSNDECWVVIDKDKFKDFDNAINKAKAENFKVAYSNESFELWFFLHFNYSNSAIGRNDYISKLTDLLKKLTRDKKTKYEKNSEDMYSLIKDKEKDAIRNAKKLLNTYRNKQSFSKNNPATTVHLLVESLNKLKQE